MKNKDKHGRVKGPNDSQSISDNHYTLPPDGEIVQDILNILKEEQQRNKELTEVVLDMARNSGTKTGKNKSIEPLKNNKPENDYKPELDNVYFDSGENKEVECNFEELSEEESVSKTSITDDKIKRLRDLVRKEV